MLNRLSPEKPEKISLAFVSANYINTSWMVKFDRSIETVSNSAVVWKVLADFYSKKSK